MKIAPLFALLALGTPLLADAQPFATSSTVGENRTYFGVKLGAVVPQHDDLEGFDNGFAFEGILGYQFSPNLAVEGSIGRFAMSADVALSDPDFGLMSASWDLRAIPVKVGLKAIAPVERVSLYGMVGAGLYFVSADLEANMSGLVGSASDSDTALGFHFGGGASVQITERASLGAELEYIMGKEETFDIGSRFDSLLVRGTLSFAM